MKKLLILALSVMMILSLTACGKKKSEDIAIADDMSVVEKFDATFKNMSDDEGVTAEVMLEKTDIDDDESITSVYSAYLPVDYIRATLNNNVKEICGTVYNLPKKFEVDVKKGQRKWTEIVKARHLPSEKEILDSVMENDEVYFDKELNLPVFFA